MKNHLKFTSILVLVLLVLACSSNQVEELRVVTKNYQAPDNYLQHRAQQKYFTTNDGSIAYTDHGEGDALVLMHGVPTSSWMYRKIIPKLQSKFRVISIDFLGYGSSDKPKDNGVNYTPISQAQKVKNLLAALEVNKFALLMHDMGGLIAWELLRQQSESISNLVVLNTIVHDDGFNQPNIKPGFMARQLSKAYSNKLTSTAILELTFSNLGLGGENKLSEKECYGYVKPLKEGSDQALYTFFTSINEDLFSRLDSNKTVFENYKGNTLVLWGGKDKTLTTEQIPFLQKHLNVPENNIHIYSDNDHFLVEEIPQEVILKITEFM